MDVERPPCYDGSCECPDCLRYDLRDLKVPVSPPSIDKPACYDVSRLCFCDDCLCYDLRHFGALEPWSSLLSHVHVWFS